MANNKLGIWNEAIARLPSRKVASTDENSLEASNCRLLYGSVISNMLADERHEWSFQTRRTTLAAATNDRAYEWVYAYAAPADVGTTLRLLPDLSAAGLGYPVPYPGSPYAEYWAMSGPSFDVPFIIENGIIYTNATGALLEYGVSTVDESKLSSQVTRAISLQLAAELAMPVKKDAKLRQTILQEAEVAWARAMADDFNRQPRCGGEYVSETILARHGGFINGPR